MDDLITVGIDAARAAGAYVRDSLGRVGRIEEKSDRNFATDVDRQAERMIVEAILRRFPGHGIVAEESGSRRPDAPYVWVIDPLDGTHNFIRGIPLFGVSIGIRRGEEFVAGVVYMPVEDQLYVGEQGGGAYKNGTRIAVSRRQALRECSLSFDSGIRYHPDELLAILRELSAEVFNVRMSGSSARNLTWLAEGTLDICVEFEDQPWDCAGSICFIREAGGTVTGLRGEPFTSRTVGYIATNGLVQAAVQRIVSRHAGPG